MVAFEPDLRQVVEAVVLGDIRGNQVAMVVDDRHLGRMVVVKTLRSLGLQQEVVVVKLFHVQSICFYSRSLRSERRKTPLFTT